MLPVAAIWAAGLTAPSLAQQDLALPPSLEAAEASRSTERPGAARLAAPVDRGDAVLEEVVVVGTPEFRLPDLGSEWRRQAEEAARDDARIRTEFFRAYIYDPNDPASRRDPFKPRTEINRVGFIEVFRLRFGRR